MTTFARAIELLGDPQRGHVLTALDVDGRVATWGEAAERLTGYSQGEVVGSPFSVLWSDPISTERLRPPSEQGLFVDSALLAPKRGDQFLVTRRVAPVSDIGQRTGFLVAICPIPSKTEPPTPDRLATAVLKSVMHPIFAASLELNSLINRLDDPSLRKRVLGSIDHLDEALRNLRRLVVDAEPPADTQ